ncbi:hypothetical protein KI688_002955 [Linnemannia hyalina]|uniref:Uncharacterized protein n=1 Tax=Linnemannia hyalina TaxID=64524 RepID=A0A9P7XS30_9FUNG|nr:hypothetical protein KI688_002955 [Linnemannia hyalina]
MVLGKNVRHVRSLNISRNFCSLYFAGLMAFQDLLDAALTVDPDGPLLLELTLYEVPVHDDDDVRLLAKTVATLTHLETLFLTVSPSPQQRITNITPRIFFSCSPSLNSFTVNIVHCAIQPQDYSRIAKCIVDNCPDLKHLGDDTQKYHDRSGEFVGKVLAAVAENSLESFYINGFQNERPQLGQAIQRHSGSLTVIEFYNCHNISSATILSILVSCVALKTFIVNEGISIGDLNTLRNPLYSQPAPVVLTEEETEWMSQLGRFYHQIGVLKELEGLELKVAIDDSSKIVSADLEDDDEDVVEYEASADDGSDEDELFSDHDSDTDYFSYQDVSFPGWLSLDNVGKGWPGYLETLTGLTKLKVLRGSFGAMTEEARRTMGARELAWFADHLPALEEVEFFRSSVSRHSFRWLKKERPDLKMV